MNPLHNLHPWFKWYSVLCDCPFESLIPNSTTFPLICFCGSDVTGANKLCDCSHPGKTFTILIVWSIRNSKICNLQYSQSNIGFFNFIIFIDVILLNPDRIVWHIEYKIIQLRDCIQ